MSNGAPWETRLVHDRNSVFRAGERIRGEISGDRTLINVDALGGEYKLGHAYRNVRNLEYRSTGRRAVETYAEYASRRLPRAPAAFQANEKRRPQYPSDEKYRNRKTRLHYPKGDMLVLVDHGVYTAIAKSIAQYVLDVGRDGYWATIYTVRGGGPEDVRKFIKSKRVVGDLLVGGIHAAWYEIDGDQFPCDLYYMDTNGTWKDTDSDGKFEDHTGNLDPELWVGRLYTPTADGNDAALLNDYFARNHKFRRGRLGHARSGLAYVDDDWQSFGDCALDEMFPSSTIRTYTDPVTTDADLYKAEVNSLRSWVQLCAHSWTHGHAFTVGADHEYIQNTYFRDTNPPNAHFYNLFCCGPGKFTTADYLAGWYVFDKAGGGSNPGLAAVASAKSGSMLMFEDFYRPLGLGACVGDAYVQWWRARGPTHEDWERYWFYGLVLLGDPTLTWWKGSVPQLEQPQKEDTFDHFPRKLQLRWDAVNIPGVKYTVEYDAYGAVSAGKWAEEIGSNFHFIQNITTITQDITFVGAQRGRWRVRAEIDGRNCAWSPWSYFRFTI